MSTCEAEGMRSGLTNPETVGVTVVVVLWWCDVGAHDHSFDEPTVESTLGFSMLVKPSTRTSSAVVKAVALCVLFVASTQAGLLMGTAMHEDLGDGSRVFHSSSVSSTNYSLIFLNMSFDYAYSCPNTASASSYETTDGFVCLNARFTNSSIESISNFSGPYPPLPANASISNSATYTFTTTAAKGVFLISKENIFILNQSTSTWDWRDKVPQSFVNSRGSYFSINTYHVAAGIDPHTGDFVLSSTSTTRSTSCSSASCQCTHYRVSIGTQMRATSIGRVPSPSMCTTEIATHSATVLRVLACCSK